MTPAQFQQWRTDMGWSIPQAALVLVKSRQAVTAWETGKPSIDESSAQLCNLAVMMRLFEGHAFEPRTVAKARALCRPLLERMAIADAMEQRGRGRPRAI